MIQRIVRKALWGLFFFAFFEKFFVPILTSGGYVGLSIATDEFQRCKSKLNNPRRKNPLRALCRERYAQQRSRQKISCTGRGSQRVWCRPLSKMSLCMMEDASWYGSNMSRASRMLREHCTRAEFQKRLSCTCCNIRECVIIWATDQPERGHYESDSMAVKIGAGDYDPATDPCCMAGKVVCGIPASLFCMDFLSAGQCATGNGDSFVPHAAVARGGSTSNADRWICDFYDTAGGRQRGRASGTGGSNASAGMVHIK